MLTLRIICGSNIGVIESFFDWRLQPHLGVVESFLDEQNLRQELDANQEKYMKYACMHASCAGEKNRFRCHEA